MVFGVFDSRNEKYTLFAIVMLTVLVTACFSGVIFFGVSSDDVAITETSLLLVDGSNPMLGDLDMNQYELVQCVVHKSSAEPSSPVEGQIYYDTDDHILYFYNNTGWQSFTSITDHGTLSGLSGHDHSQYLLVSGGNWMTGDLNMSQNEVKYAVFQNSDVAPSGPVEGQVYYNTANHVLYCYNSTDWVSIIG